jgi:hypothetical protein
MLQPSFIPPHGIRVLREYTRLRACHCHDRRAVRRPGSLSPASRDGPGVPVRSGTHVRCADLRRGAPTSAKVLIGVPDDRIVATRRARHWL